MLFRLPIEIQMMTIESITDLDSLTALYDSLPSTSVPVRDVLLNRIFLHLNDRRSLRLHNLLECRFAVHELQDWCGVESRRGFFQNLIAGIDEEIYLSEAPVEFRGLRHPSQGRTLLKKENMREKANSTSPKLRSRRYQHSTTAVHSLSEAHEIVKRMWTRVNDEVCPSTFKENLYGEQITT